MCFNMQCMVMSQRERGPSCGFRLVSSWRLAFSRGGAPVDLGPVSSEEDIIGVATALCGCPCGRLCGVGETTAEEAPRFQKGLVQKPMGQAPHAVLGPRG